MCRAFRGRGTLRPQEHARFLDWREPVRLALQEIIVQRGRARWGNASLALGIPYGFTSICARCNRGVGKLVAELEEIEWKIERFLPEWQSTSMGGRGG